MIAHDKARILSLHGDHFLVTHALMIVRIVCMESDTCTDGIDDSLHGEHFLVTHALMIVMVVCMESNSM